MSILSLCCLDLTTVLIFTVVLVAGLWLFGSNNRSKLPPGPTGLPIIGYLPFLGWKPHIKLTELKKKYGPIYSLRIGGQTAVFLTDFQSMKETFNKEAFLGAPNNTEGFHNKETIESGVFTGPAWLTFRKFTLHALRDLGLGKSRLEIHIAEEIEEMLERLEKEKGKPVYPRDFLSASTSNNIASLVFGNRRKFEDPKRIMLASSFDKVNKLVQKVIWIEFFPFLKKLIQLSGMGLMKNLQTAISYPKKFVREEVNEHIKTFDPNNIRDYIDKFLLEMEKHNSNTKMIFQVPILEDACVGFFFAGSTTVRGVLEWFLLISAAYPEVQKKVQAEIDEVIGHERFPTRADHLQMPYTEATIMETLRWRASVPLNMPKVAIEDSTIGPYMIPKNIQVIAVIWAVHHDPALWGEDVDSFKPERFLSEDGTKIHKPEYYMPFSMGKRSCIGESLAYVEMFMYFTAILRKFNLRLPDGEEPDLEGVIRIGMETKPYKLYFDPR